MSATVISHHTPRGKRARAWAWTLRRIGVLTVTAAALATAVWLSPTLHRQPQKQAVSAAPIAPPAPAPSAATEAVIDTPSPAAPAPRARVAARRTNTTLDTAPAAAAPGYEVLTAAELAAISQARE